MTMKVPMTYKEKLEKTRRFWLLVAYITRQWDRETRRKFWMMWWLRQ